MSFAARWPGTCPECDGRFDVDDQIVRVGFGTAGDYRHTVCPDDTPEKPTRFLGTTLDQMGF